jgi:hypothetical protein
MELHEIEQAIMSYGDRGEVAKTDAATATGMARQLEFVIAKTHEKKFPELPMAEGAVLPIDSSIGPGFETYTYYVYEGAGFAIFLNAYSQASLPRVGEAAKRVTGHIEHMGNSYGYNWADLQQAALKPGFGSLEGRKVKTARRGHAQKQSDTAWYGNTELNFFGLLTHPNITTTAAPATGVDGSSSWREKTFEQVLIDFDVLINTPENLTNKIEVVNTVLLPRDMMTYLTITPINSANSSNISIMDYLRKVHTGVTFEGFNELIAANSNGALSGDVALAYNRDKDNASLVIPQPYTQMTPHWDGLELTVATISSFGGVKMVYPLAFNLMTGIAG